jgi:hypothetical protein
MIVTCVQAAWFCSQCIARMSSGLAISLLELNTFAHCVSAFFIYGFWWHKPYDVTSHTFIQSEILDFLFLRNAAVKASQRPDDISGEPTVELYVEDAVGAREHLAEVNLKRVRPEQEDDGDFLNVTERDMIPGTRFSLKKIGSTGTGNCAFFLPKQSMIHWQRLWCFLDETSFAVASVDTLKTQSQPERRFKNLRGDLGDFLVAIFLPGPKLDSVHSTHLSGHETPPPICPDIGGRDDPNRTEPYFIVGWRSLLSGSRDRRMAPKDRKSCRTSPFGIRKHHLIINRPWSINWSRCAVPSSRRLHDVSAMPLIETMTAILDSRFADALL